ncbi:MAG: ribonuclease P protein subunit [Candidatus Altiarchaeota archaeon]
MITPYNILRHEYVGLTITVNNSNTQITGEIIDETKQTFTIKTRNKRQKKILKKDNTFEVKLKDLKIEVSGSLLSQRPEERIKRKTRIIFA